MSNWQLYTYEKLKCLEQLMKDHLKKGPFIQMDETTVSVFKEEDRKDEQKSYMWLARGGPVDKPIVLYQYYKTRNSIIVHDFIKGYSGFLQTDGYQGYKTAVEKHKLLHPSDKITHVGCFAHARRKFHEASVINKQAKSPQVALSFIKKIYTAENKLRELNLSNEDFLQERDKMLTPILNAFHEWLVEKSQQIPPSQKMGEGITYSLNQWEHLCAYKYCAELTPDNNASERAIRPFVLGRKNWLFFGSPEGAKSSCFLYSLIESAKENKLNPFDYLHHVFSEAPYCTSQDDFEKLLPWNANPPTPIPLGTWQN